MSLAPALWIVAVVAVVFLLRADNLGGARYEEVNGFPAPGRSIFAGLRATLNR